MNNVVQPWTHKGRDYKGGHPYGFTYRITNEVNGFKYYGKTKCQAWTGYLGSGVRMKQAVRDYGKSQFKREILQFFSDENSLTLGELAIIEDLNYDEVYNLPNATTHQALRMPSTYLVKGSPEKAIMKQLNRINKKVDKWYKQREIDGYKFTLCHNYLGKAMVLWYKPGDYNFQDTFGHTVYKCYNRPVFKVEFNKDGILTIGNQTPKNFHKSEVQGTRREDFREYLDSTQKHHSWTMNTTDRHIQDWKKGIEKFRTLHLKRCKKNSSLSEEFTTYVSSCLGQLSKYTIDHYAQWGLTPIHSVISHFEEQSGDLIGPLTLPKVQ